MQTLTPYNHPNYKNHPPEFPPSYASAWGKDQYGIWFEVSIKQVAQRFRWIPKGQFTMGSPESEEEHQSHETLHEVTLTQGFWLADSACTQELWQEVMGENPSHFDDDLQNPIETVSWLDVQSFLTKLNQTIPNLNAHLPTEAQWEYACRAGTIAPFSFGENISPDLINYDGNYPYANGKKGGYRGKTVSVKALPANQWGLYQMHGNVWEWCLDEYQGNLGTESVFDPVNVSFKVGSRAAKSNLILEKISVYDNTLLDNAGDGIVKRVLRGGSWSNIGRFCRSAMRVNSRSDYCSKLRGFRFALGH